MRVLQVNAVYGSGSIGIIMQDIGEAIRAAGGEAHFAYMSTNQPVANGYRIGNAIDRKIHALLSRLLGGWGFYSRSVTRKFLKHIDKLKPDVVHLHNLHSNYIHTELLLQHLAEWNIPTVVTMHDCWYFTGMCTYPVLTHCKRFITGCGDCPQLRLSPFFTRSTPSWMVDTTARDLERKKQALLRIPNLTMVGCSKWICGEARKSFLKDRHIIHIPNGVNTELFHPMDAVALKQQYGILDDEYVVLGMAHKWMNEEDQKLIPVLLQAMPELRLVIIGCTETQKQELAPYANQVIAVGFIHDRRELAMHYSLADVFVNVTHADNLPTVNMESICCGTPVITYDSSGSPELVSDTTGIVIKEGDFEAVISALQAVRLQHWDTCAETGKALFDKKNHFLKYIRLYEEIVQPPVC